MKPFAFLTLLLAATASAAEVETLSIKTLQAQMRYDTTELTVSPGAAVKIVFENTDDMPHNLVIFQPGTDVVAVCNKQMEKPEEALKRNWLPEDPRLWLHSKLLNPKEREEITFTAPETPGIYPFVCTFPGHAQTMQGRLRIAAPGPKLTSLHFAMYLGDWKTLPDFATLTPHREGELDGVVDLPLDDYKNQFGVVYTGQLRAPKDGEFRFFAASDDGVRLFIDGEKWIDHDGIHSSAEIKARSLKLTAGEHTIRLEYFQGTGKAELYFAWSGPDMALTPLSKWIHPDARSTDVKKKEGVVTGMPLVVEKEPIIYRNFITGGGSRSIGVGLPGGVNFAWNAQTMNLTLLWRGAFIDAARHWTNRGGGPQPPLGFDVVRIYTDALPPFALADSPWPALPGDARPEGYRWKGYTLEVGRRPVFHYEWLGQPVSDTLEAEGERVTRTVKLAGTIPPGALFCAASAKKIEPGEKGFLVDDGPLVLDKTTYENRFQVTVEGGVIKDGRLLVPARAEMKITYSWLNAHQHNY